MFKAIMISKNEAGQHVALTEISEDQLPESDVTVRVHCSTLNYKDALAITGKGPVVRRFPMVPGVDLAGVVEQSDHPEFRAGDAVILNGWGVGETHWGGLAQYVRLKGDWLIPLNPAFSPEQAMGIGTAGYTAIQLLCVKRARIFRQTYGRGPRDAVILKQASLEGARRGLIGCEYDLFQ